MAKQEDGLSKEAKPTKPFRIYYDQRYTDITDIRHSIVRTVGVWSDSNIDVRRYKSENATIDWRCFYCHTKIDVNVNGFDGKDMFCENHRPKVFSKSHKENPLLLRYISSFYSKVRQRIINNTDIEQLYG